MRYQDPTFAEAYEETYEERKNLINSSEFNS